MYGAGIELEPKDITDNSVFIGFCLDHSGTVPSWIILAGENEEELKQAMIEDGADPELSFVVKVKVPDVSNVKKPDTKIRTLDLNKVEGVTEQKH
jgi:hypothetical protein